MSESTRIGPAAGAPAARPARRGPGRTRAGLALAVTLLALAAHANVVGHDFAGDAVPWVRANPLLHGLSSPRAIITSPYRTDVAPAHSPWRPLTALTHALSWSAGGGTAAPYHTFDIALHALVTLLVFVLLGVLGAAPVVAAAGAALFAVHPVHVEAIASIVGRADLLVALFSLVAVLAHLRLRTVGLRIPVVALCYAAALGAKESGAALPGLLLAVELVRAGDVRAFARAVRRQWPLWAALLAVLALYFGARHAVLGTFTGRDVAPYIAALPAPLRVATAIANWTTYARLLFAPWELSADYGPAVTLPAGLLSLRFWAGLLILAGSLALAWLGRARAPLAALGVLWFTVAVFPVTNLLVATPVWIAERTLYSPSIAAALLLAALGAELQRREPRARRLATAGLALVLVLFGVRSWQRSRTWADSDTVARTLITERPESFRSAWWLARMLAASGQYERAAAHFERARSLLPGSGGVAGDYAGMLLDAGRPAEAEAVLRRLPLDESADMGIYLVRALVMQARHREAAAVLDTLRTRFPRDWRLPALAARLDSVRVAPR